MNERKIKILKRNTPITVVNRAVTTKDPKRGMTNTVAQWISERRENSRAERTADSRQLFF